MKTTIIGLGTGRCGTTTLANLLSLQQNCHVSHELGRQDRLPWETDEKLFTKYWAVVQSKSDIYIGDVAFYLLPYINLIADKNVKLIIVKRNKEETINSYMKHTNGRNHWMLHDGKEWKKDDKWDICYPKYDVSTKKEALSLFYNDYYNECKKINTSNVFWLDTEDLNSKNKMMEMLIFCGFKKPIFKKIIANKGLP